MSAAGYSDRLSKHSNKGRLNLRSNPDPATAVLGKVKVLAQRMLESSHTVLHTGAGLSTAAGINDFRGPSGVWTLERAAAKVGHAPEDGGRGAVVGPAEGRTVSFETAVPTLSHMVIVALYRAKLVHHVVSQNVDCLHLRSGLPRAALSELHGNLFVEFCPECRKEFVREYEAKSVGFKPVDGGSRKCACGGTLTDKALDWSDSLPQEDLDSAVEHSRKAEVAVVVGSSCQMDPARGLPFRSKVKGAKFALLNLSRTQMDRRFSVCCGVRACFLYLGVSACGSDFLLTRCGAFCVALAFWSKFGTDDDPVDLRRSVCASGARDKIGNPVL